MPTTLIIPDSTQSDFVRGCQALGSVIKAQTIGVNANAATAAVAMTDNIARIVAVYLRTYETLTGIKFFITTQGNFTGDNFNGFGLYTYSGGTITLVATSANDANIWKNAANTLVTVPFTASYAAVPGIYFVMAVYNNSAQVTAPQFAIANNPTSSVLNSLDLTNSANLSSSLAGVNSLPATQAMSGTSVVQQSWWVGLY